LFWNLPPYEMSRWPVFNVADMAVSTGMIIILLATLFEKNSEMAVAANATPEDSNISNS